MALHRPKIRVEVFKLDRARGAPVACSRPNFLKRSSLLRSDLRFGFVAILAGFSILSAKDKNSASEFSRRPGVRPHNSRLPQPEGARMSERRYPSLTFCVIRTQSICCRRSRSQVCFKSSRAADTSRPSASISVKRSACALSNSSPSRTWSAASSRHELVTFDRPIKTACGAPSPGLGSWWFSKPSWG